MSEPLFINCKCHGENHAAVVCGHLIQNQGNRLGFIENCSDPTNPQGWCYACEYVFLQEQDKTERFTIFCDMGIVCATCYTEIKARHEID